MNNECNSLTSRRTITPEDLPLKSVNLFPYLSQSQGISFHVKYFLSAAEFGFKKLSFSMQNISIIYLFMHLFLDDALSIIIIINSFD